MQSEMSRLMKSGMRGDRGEEDLEICRRRLAHTDYVGAEREEL